MIPMMGGLASELDAGQLHIIITHVHVFGVATCQRRGVRAIHTFDRALGAAFAGSR